MAITNVAVSWQGGVPAANGQVTADRASAGKAAQVLYGTATVVADGSSTTATLCYIDAPNANSQISFSPSGIVASRSGGNANANAYVASVVDAGTKNAAALTIGGVTGAQMAAAQTFTLSLILIP